MSQALGHLTWTVTDRGSQPTTELYFAPRTVWPDDQIVFSIFGHFQHWNLPKSIQNVQTRVKNFAQNQLNLQYIAKDFYIFAKVVEFRQIWSHWR